MFFGFKILISKITIKKLTESYEKVLKKKPKKVSNNKLFTRMHLLFVLNCMHDILMIFICSSPNRLSHYAFLLLFELRYAILSPSHNLDFNISDFLIKDVYVVIVI